MRLIDADMLMERITMLNNADLLTMGRIIATINTQPTVENGYNQVLEDFTRQLSVRLIELPLDDLIVADILNDVKGIYEQLKE